jgi:hypothetical protein
MDEEKRSGGGGGEAGQAGGDRRSSPHDSPMIDLPLRPGSGDGRRDERSRPAADGSVPLQQRAATEPVRGPGAPKKPPTSGSPRSRKAAVLVLSALLVAVVLWWLFLPAPARITASESALVFDSARVGHGGGTTSVTLSNAGERALRVSRLEFGGSAAGDFSVERETCSGRAIPPGESCEVAIGFLPAAAGERRANLEVHGNVQDSPFILPVGASAVAPEVGLAPSRIEFGAVQVGDQRAAVELTISNIGSATLGLGRIRFEGPQAEEFDRDRRCPDTTLEPGEACTMMLRFTPRAAGSRVAELVLTSDDPSSPARLPLRGRGVWEGPPLEPDPERVELGEQRVGRRSETSRIQFVNRMSDAVEVGGAVITPGTVPFGVAADDCSGRTLFSGESCSVGVSVEPDREGSLSGVLEVRFATAGSLRIPLTARGVEPRLELDSETVDFGSMRTGFESGSRAVDLVNTGSATLQITTARLAGENTGDFVLKRSCAGEVLAAGERCSLRLAFRPRAEGPRRARLEIVPSEELSSMSISLGGVGTAADLAVDATALEWESLQIGMSGERRLTIANNGSARLDVRGLRIAGEAMADFAVSRIGCALDGGLAVGQRCELTLRFTPSAEAVREANLEIEHNGPDSPAIVALSGSGEPPRPLFRASARDVGFGVVGIGARSDIATLTITNAGSAWLQLRGIRIGGEHVTDFGLVAGTCDGVTALAPGGECTVGIRFTPTASGSRQAILEVRHGAAGSPALISLSGLGG